MKYIKPAIVVVGYNRLLSLRRLLNSIERANYEITNDITLVISVDYCNGNEEITNEANHFVWKHGQKIVRKFSEKQGLRKHIIQCGDLASEYGGVIILEDDLVVSPLFYQYAYLAMNEYKDVEQIAGIALYSYQVNNFAQREFIPVKFKSNVFLSKMAVTWGQCWTNEQWCNFKCWYENNLDLPNTNKIPKQIYNWPNTSWGKYFTCYTALNNLYYVMPYVALSTNFSEAGQHNNNRNSSFQVPLNLFSNHWHFCKFKDALRYDCFFEIENNLFEFDEKIHGDLTVDLYGLKYDFSTRYILSSQLLHYKIIDSYALEMRPHEMNVINQVIGCNIHLYDSSISYLNKFEKNDIKLEIFEIRSKNIQLLENYIKFMKSEKIKIRLNRLKKALKIKRLSR